MDYISIGIGTIVSVVLFIISYQKTIGAKKERVNSTYYEIVKILIRNLVNNNHIPSIPEINRLLQTKSLENKINITNLPGEITFIYALYTRIAEDEILSSDKKKEIISKINNYLKKLEKKAPRVTVEEKEFVDKEEKYRILLALVSILIATFGVFTTGFFPTKVITIDTLSTLLIAVVAMTVVLTGVIFFIKLKEGQEETTASQVSIIKEYKEFENAVFKITKGLGETVKEPMLRRGDKTIIFDISFKKGNKNFLIEIKSFRSYTPKFTIEKLKAQAKLAKEIDNNSVPILVVNNKKYLMSYIDELNRVWDHVFDIDELKDFRNKLLHNIE